MYTLGDLPRNGAALFGDRTAVVFEDHRYTYDELNRRINRCAHALTALGLAPGDRLAVMADNCAKYLELYFAAAKLGMSITPVNVRLGDNEIDYILAHSECSAFAVGDGYEARAEGLRDRLAAVQHWLSLDTTLSGFHDYEAHLASASDDELDRDRYQVREDDLAILMYTGGTTGLPKGVMLSHRNAMTAAIAAALQLKITRDDSTCFALPIFHVAWWPIPMVLLVGGKACIVRQPDLNAMLSLIQTERCTHLNLVPTVYGWMADDPRTAEYNLSSLRIMTYAGSPFPVAPLKRCIRQFGNIFTQAYGATETAGGPITILDSSDHHLEGDGARLLASAGRPAVCSRVKVVSDADTTLGPGEIGEVCVTGAHIMMGYWKNPELTAQELRDGWYHTGDMGYLDEQGFVFLTDRKSDMIITGGENVYPTEVENVLHMHEAVLECAVVGTVSDKWGETVHAAIVLRPGAAATAEELIDHCKSILASYKCPKAVTFIESVPKTSIGKISRKDARELIKELIK
jgi:acyl-CoA synthetase (AMP-forming)/AMP-acid ligase II